MIKPPGSPGKPIYFSSKTTKKDTHGNRLPPPNPAESESRKPFASSGFPLKPLKDLVFFLSPRSRPLPTGRNPGKIFETKKAAKPKHVGHGREALHKSCLIGQLQKLRETKEEEKWGLLHLFHHVLIFALGASVQNIHVALLFE